MMNEHEILQKLEGTFAQEGARFEVLGSKEQRLLVRACRIGPGVPIAFLVKALEGTLRRYHPELREVELVEYDPGEGHATPDKPSETFEKVLKHQSAAMKMSLPEAPGLDLKGCDRIQAVQALEQAHKMWSRQGVHHFKVRGLKEEQVARAFEKWRSFYGEVAGTENEDEDTLRVTLQGAPEGEFPTEATMWFPARLMLISENL
jgi:hypothetical protein